MAQWQIADGYYIYKDKISFEFGKGVSLTANPGYPATETKQDSLFGEVEVFTKTFNIELPVSTSNLQQFTLTAKAQGCNEPVGICYPPMTRVVEFIKTAEGTYNISSDLLTTPTIQTSIISESDSSTNSPSNFSETNSASDLRALLSAGFEEQEFLDVDTAFKLNLESLSKDLIEAHFKITEGYYLYKEKISVTVNTEVQDIDFPKGKTKQDEYFGEVEIFDSDFKLQIPTSGFTDDDTLQINYQGCAEEGICYSPVTKVVTLGSLNSDNNTDSGDSISAASIGATPIIDIPGEIITSKSGQRPLLGLLIGAFIAGLLLTFTPCVLPLIPILSSVIAGQGSSLTRSKAAILSITYVVGTMVTYAAMGALAGATGDQLQAYFQNIWAIGILSGLFFIMALSMFGLFELQVPSFIQERIQTKTGHLGGSIPMVFILGLFSALIVGACVSPVLISFLGVAMSSQSPVLGAQLMLAMALGMGIPLIAIGIGAGHFIPKAGQWMEKVKQAFGVMLIGVAIYLLGQLPEVPILLVWGSFFIILSAFLGIGQRSHDNPTILHRFEKGIGIILVVWGIFLIAGGFFGQRDLLHPIPKNFFSSVTSQSSSIQPNSQVSFVYIKTIDELESQLASAKLDNKYVLVDYYADWCVDCVRMDKTTFQDAEVSTLLSQNFISLKIDVTDPNNKNGKALKQRYNVFGPPATLFINPSGDLLTEKNFYGYMAPGEFLSHLKSL